MIRKLRWKFIAAAMLSLLLVLGTLIALINILNYRNLVTEADDMLVMLSEFDDSFPFPMGNPNMPDRGDGKGRGERKDFNGERPYQSRYFTVLLSETGEVQETNLKNVVTVDEQTAIEMAETAAKKGREAGFSGDYRYLGVPEDAIIGDAKGLRTLDSVLRMRDVFGYDDFITISQRGHCERALYLAEHHGISTIGFEAGVPPLGLLYLDEWLGSAIRAPLSNVKAILDIATGRHAEHPTER